MKHSNRILAVIIALAMILTVATSLFVTAAESDYSGHWAKDDIAYLIDNAYLTADADGNVQPDSAMPRGKIVSLINKVKGFTVKASEGFADLKEGDEYYDAFMIAKGTGYIMGDEKGNANANSTVTRAEIAVILTRLYDLDTLNVDTSSLNENDVPQWAMPSVAAMKKSGIMVGNADGTFGGYSKLTNAEGYTVISRMARGVFNTSDVEATMPPKVEHTPIKIHPQDKDLTIKVYEDVARFDRQPKIVDGTVWVSSQSVVELMQFDWFPSFDRKSFTIRNEWMNATLTVDSSKVILNGKEVEINAPYLEDLRYWMNLDDIMMLTNSTYTFNESTYAIEIQSPKLPEAREATDKDIIVTPQFRSAHYVIPSTNPDAEVTVWTYQKTTGDDGWRNGVEKWWKEYTPYYSEAEGGFAGSLTYLDEDVDCKVRVRIRENGKEDLFVATYHTRNAHNVTRDEYFIKDAGMTIIPTFNNLGVYVNVKSAHETYNYSSTTYRKKGETEWKQAFRLDYDPDFNQYRGSIVQVEADTTYEVHFELKNMNGEVIETADGEVTTWTENPPIAKEIKLSEIYKPGKNIVLQNIKGTADGWIKIVGDLNQEIQVSDEFWEAIFVGNCEYLILENIKINGGYRHGIMVCDQSKDVRISNCDIQGWGRAGNIAQNGTYRDNTNESLNNEAGVYINDVTNLVVEKCYFHDCKGRSNAWQGLTWKSKHPAGPSALYGRAYQGLVVRYNDAIGSDEHRWNDAFETYHNFDKWGGMGHDSDVYGNYFVFGQDDSTEIDGMQMNLRFYGNKAEGFLCGMSTACTTVGPSYVFRNLIINEGDEHLKNGGAMKNGQSKEEYTGGFCYIMHNTFDWAQGIAQTSGYYLPYARNNILQSSSETGTAAKNTFDKIGISFDYDLHWGKVTGPQGSEEHGIPGQASFANITNADYNLVEGSLGIDKAQKVPNFSDVFNGEGPDMGAAEYGTDTLFPTRPINIRADKYQLNFVDKETQTVTFKIGDVAEGTTYRILKNNVFDFIEIEGELEGTLKPNSTITFKVTSIPENVEFRRGSKAQMVEVTGKGFVNRHDYFLAPGAFILKLSDGYSVPITVYLDSTESLYK